MQLFFQALEVISTLVFSALFYSRGLLTMAQVSAGIKYLFHVKLCLQGMVQDASKEIAGHWYWKEAFVFARHFVTTSFRSKIFDFLLLDGVLVGV